jgi:hypothetical protein
MKKFLLTVLAALTLTASGGRAQIDFSGGTDGAGFVVYDPTAVTQLLEQVGISQEQLTQLVETYKQVVQVYGMATQIWNSVSGLAGASGWAPALNNPALRNPLPFAAADHPGWVGGFNDPSSLPVYDDGSFVGPEILKAIRSLSSMQAVATNHVQSIETRIAALGNLFSQLDNIDTVQKTDGLSARLNTELNYANSQQVQAQQVMSAAQLQLAVLDYNQRQWLYQDETNGITAACASVQTAGGFVTIPACK